MEKQTNPPHRLFSSNLYGVLVSCVLFVLFVCLFVGCLVGWLSMWDKLEFSGNQEPQLRKNVSIRLAWRQICGYIFLIHHWCERDQIIVGYNTSWQVVLGSRKMELSELSEPREQASDQNFSMVLLYFLPPRFLSWVPTLAFHNDELWSGHVSQMNPFLLSVAFCHGLYHTNRR